MLHICCNWKWNSNRKLSSSRLFWRYFHDVAKQCFCCKQPVDSLCKNTTYIRYIRRNCQWIWSRFSPCENDIKWANQRIGSRAFIFETFHSFGMWCSVVDQQEVITFFRTEIYKKNRFFVIGKLAWVEFLDLKTGQKERGKECKTSGLDDIDRKKSKKMPIKPTSKNNLPHR